MLSFPHLFAIICRLNLPREKTMTHGSNKLALALLLSITSAVAAGLETAVMDLQRIHCVACLRTVEKALDKVPGVEDTRLDLESRTATVQYDPVRTDPESLVRATAEAGFPATVRK